MKRLYVAGKLNDNAVGYIKNIHRMINTARELRRLGFAVYVPCNDFLEGLVDGDFGYEEYFDNSQPWLMASDGVYLTPGWESSTGTAREIELANSLDIPVFDKFEDLLKYFER